MMAARHSFARVLCCTALIALIAAIDSSPAQETAAPYAGEPTLDDTSNLAAATHGAVILDVTTGADATGAIDGNAEGGWLAAARFDPASPIDLALTLAGDRPQTVGEILIQPRHWQRGSHAPALVEVLLDDTSVGTYALPDTEGWQRLSFTPLPASRVTLRILDIHGAGRVGLGEIALYGSLPEVAAEAPPDPIVTATEAGMAAPLDRHAENSLLRIDLYGYVLTGEHLGSTPPADRSFLLLRGAIGNRSAELPVLLPDVTQVFSLMLGAQGNVPLDPAAALGSYPFTGEIEITAGGRRPFTMVFAVPDPLPEGTALLFSGTDAGSLIVPLFGEEPDATTPTTLSEVAAAAQNDGQRLTVDGVSLEEMVGGITAPEGLRFAVVDLGFERLLAPPIELPLGDFVMLVENGQYTHAPDPAGAALDPGAYGTRRYDPGTPVAARLAFLVPEVPGQLALRMATEDGALVVPIGEPVAAPEVPAVGPESSGLLELALFAPAPLDAEGIAAAAQPVVADVALTLHPPDPLATLVFDPLAAFQLVDAAGQVFPVASSPAWLERPLGVTELWAEQPARGTLFFALPAEAEAPFALRLGTQPPLVLALPAAREEAPAATVGRESLSLDLSTTEEPTAVPDAEVVAVVVTESEPAPLLAMDDQTLDPASVVNPNRDLVNVLAFDNGGEPLPGGDDMWQLTDGQTGDQAPSTYSRFHVAKNFALPLPYRIERLLIDLAPGEGDSYDARIEGSLDGQTWIDLAAFRHHPDDGPLSFDIAPTAVRYLRFSAGNSDTQDESGFYHIRELQAWTRDPVADMRRDVVSFFRGGEARSPTSAEDGWYPLWALNNQWDGTYPWLADSPAPHEVVVEVFDGRVATIHAVLVQPDHYFGDNRFTDAAPREVEVLVSADAEGAVWQSVARRILPPGLAGSLITFPPVEAARVKLRVLSTQVDGLQPAIGEVAAYEAGGVPSVFDDFVSGLVPDESGLHAERNVALFLNGGRLVERSEGVNWQLELAGADLYANQKVLSGDPDYHSEALFVQPGDHITIGFHDGQATTVEQVNLYSYTFSGWGDLMRSVELASSMTGPDGPFTTIGRWVVSREVGWHTIRFPPTEMRYLRFTVLSRYGGDHAGFTQFQAIESADVAHSLLTPLSVEEAFPGSRNIALAALGGTVFSTAPWEREDWPLGALNDGHVSSYYGGYDRSWGWSSAAAPEYPVDIDVGFRDGGIARIAGIAINPMVRLANYGGFDSSWFGDRYSWPRDFEIWVSTQGATGPWTQVGGTFELRNLNAMQAFAFDAPVEARTVRLRFLTNYEGQRLQIGEVEVYEAPDGPSIIAGVPVDLASPVMDGVTATFTSQTENGWRAWLTDDDAATAWNAWDTWLPQRFLFAFRDISAALVDRIELTLPADADPASWPHLVRIEASTANSPDEGFTEIATFALEQRPGIQVLQLPEPVLARYLSVVITETGGAPASLAGLRIIEGMAPDYTSILTVGRDDPVPPVSAEVAAGTLPSDITESEPNDSIATAQTLAADIRVGGTIEPQRDRDVFALDTTEATVPGLRVNLAGLPHIKTFLELSDATGEVLATHDPWRAAQEEELFWYLPQGRYDLTLYEPPTSVVLLFDDSGSMADRVADLKLAAARYIADRLEHEEMMVMRFNTAPIVLSDFSHDSTALAAAVQDQLVASGGTALYDAMLAALDALEPRRGNRAIILLSDGADTSSATWLDGVWTRLAAAGVRVYAIGLGPDLEVHADTLGEPPGQLLDFWARLTGGRYYFAPGSAELLEIYGEISRELRATPHYRLSYGSPEAVGQLAVEATGERIEGVASAGRVALILDASGSMEAKNSEGLRRITVARDVMHTVIAALPDSAQVGLRVYGHRLPREPKAASCEDTELVVPFGPVDKAALDQAVDAITPHGQTPIGRSLAHIAGDLADAEGPKLVVLVTDGIETCDENPGDPFYPPDVIAQLNAAGAEIRVNIVGFDIGDSATRDFLLQIAELSGGSYFDAGTTEELANSIDQALQAGYAVTDSRGTVVARGTVDGPALELPEGHYTVTLETEPPVVFEDVVLTGKRLSLLTVEREGSTIRTAVSDVEPGSETVTVAAPAAAEPEDADPSAAAPEPAVPETPADDATRIAQLLAEGDRLRADQQLTTPEGESALDRYRDVLAIDPGNAAAEAGIREIIETYRDWAYGALEAEQDDKAERYAQRGLALAPDDADLELVLGVALAGQRRYDEARASFQRVLQLDPLNETAIEFLDAIAAPSGSGSSGNGSSSSSSSGASGGSSGMSSGSSTSSSGSGSSN